MAVSYTLTSLAGGAERGAPPRAQGVPHTGRAKEHGGAVQRQGPHPLHFFRV
jgi:hypothetical protein